MKIKQKNSAKLFSTTCVLFSVLLFSNCKKEESFIPSDVPETSTVSLNDSTDRLAIKESEVGSSYYNISNALPAGYVKDGSKDYTSYIQAAINKYSNIVFPGFPIMVNDNGLTIPSNRRIVFAEGSQLRLKPTSKGSYMVIRIVNVSNVTLANPYIIGDRYAHKGTSGEWGNGIGIYGGNNINISKARVENCWGDGIYIGKSSNSTNQKIRLFKPYLKNNRRDGISIIDANGLEIISPYAGYSNGTAPFCGINIEPNDYTNEIKNILISNPVTEHNKGNGIQIGLGKLYGKVNKEVSIKITNHLDKESGTGLKTSCRTTIRKGTEVVSGTLSVVGSNWQKNSVKPLEVYFQDKNLKFELSKPKVMNSLGTYLSSVEAKSILEYRKSIWSPTVFNITY